MDAVGLTALYTPLMHSTTGDLNIGSHGEVVLSVPDSSRALVLSTPDNTTEIDAETKNLEVRSPTFGMSGRVLDLSVPNSLVFTTGGADDPSVSTFAMGLNPEAGLVSGCQVGTGEKDYIAGSYLRVDPVGDKGISMSTSGPGTVPSTVALTPSGRVTGRSSTQAFTVLEEAIIDMNVNKVTINKDIDIKGALNTINGSITTLNISDNTVHVASSSSTELEVSASPSGVAIDTVPGSASDAPYLNKFLDLDGTPLFVDADGSTVNVQKMMGSGIFNKRLVHHVAGGAKSGGMRTRLSRQTQPVWEVEGGALRVQRWVGFDHATNATTGAVKYAMDLRVSDNGSFEVVRLKTPHSWVADAGRYEPGATTVSVMQRSIPPTSG